MENIQGSLSMIKNPAILVFILKGVAFTLIISVAAVLISILWGSVLAMLRNYCNSGMARVLKWISVVYIEVFRNTPLLFWIFICLVFCPSPAFMDRPMFGLSSVNNKLLFKAGHSQGFHMVQIMCYIVLPQAFRAIIPTLLSQIITTIKDSSFLANVAVIELMARTKQILSAANRYNGSNAIHVSDVFILFGLAAVIYFVINFSLSVTVRKIQKRREKQAVVRPGAD